MLDQGLKGAADFSEVCCKAGRGSFSPDNDSLEGGVFSAPSGCMERTV